jgi:hypothetical protein
LAQFYQWSLTVVVFAIVQVLWIQTSRSAMIPLEPGSWLIALVIASGVFWLNELLSPN